MNVTDAAVEKAVMVRARETEPERYALWVEVAGVQGGEYAYDLSLQPLAEAPADASVTDLGRISLVIPAESVELLRGATLDRQGDLATGGLVIHNRTPPSPAIGVPESADLTGDVARQLIQVLEQTINHFVHANTFGLGTVTHQNAMPQRGVNHGANIVDRGVVAAFQECP